MPRPETGQRPRLMYNPRPVNEALGKDPGLPFGGILTTVAEFKIEYHPFFGHGRDSPRTRIGSRGLV
jgi:hypothetical protein